MEEIWKDIEGYEGLYQVSNTGKILSFRAGRKKGKPDKYILNPTISNNGYQDVTLYRSPNDRHKLLVHKIVAKAFVPNPNNYECVNHKDENPLNNNADNLEWCTYSYNNAYGTARIRQSITKGQKVGQYTLEGIHLATYESAYVASLITGIYKHSINDCCCGRAQSGAGYIWKFE